MEKMGHIQYMKNNRNWKEIEIFQEDATTRMGHLPIGGGALNASYTVVDAVANICAVAGNLGMKYGRDFIWSHVGYGGRTLDKETVHKKDRVMPEYAELVYNGYWFSKKRIKLQKIIDKKRNKVSGDIVLSIYKGNVTILSRRTTNKAYSMKKVSFEENKTFNKKKVEDFIKFHSKQLNKG